jgi:dsRNA-specific ribonuclease
MVTLEDLSECCSNNGIEFSYIHHSNGPSHLPSFIYELSFGDVVVTATESSTTLKAARWAAIHAGCGYLQYELGIDLAFNTVSIYNLEHQATFKKPPVFDYIKSGPDHNPTFVCKSVLSRVVYLSVPSSSKATARQLLATTLLQALNGSLKLSRSYSITSGTS